MSKMMQSIARQTQLGSRDAAYSRIFFLNIMERIVLIIFPLYIYNIKIKEETGKICLFFGLKAVPLSRLLTVPDGHVFFQG